MSESNIIIYTYVLLSEKNIIILFINFCYFFNVGLTVRHQPVYKILYKLAGISRKVFRSVLCILMRKLKNASLMI